MSDIFSENNEGCKIAELDEIAMILMGISDNMFSGPSVSVSGRGTYFLQGESITASENTIKSIDFCCHRGYFADAFTLARKYRDDIIQYVFIGQIVENMPRLDDEEFKRALVFLRRAFADFSAREKDEIAENLGEIWGLNKQEVSEILNATLDDTSQQIIDSLDDFDFDI